LFYELGKAMVGRGQKITVLTGFPKYNVDQEKLSLKYKKKFAMKEKVCGMDVLRIKVMSLPRYIPIARGMEHFINAFIFLLRGLFVKREAYDKILVYSPPLPLGLTAYVLSRIKKVPYIFNVQDIFPQSAIDLGVLRNKVLINILRKIEKFIYKNAAVIAVHSEGNREYVISRGITPEKVKVVPNWVDTDAIKPGGAEHNLRKEWGLGDKFVVSFAGVIGYSQDLDIVIDSVEYLKDCNDMMFLIIGDGVVKQRLKDTVDSRGINNIHFFPMQPKEIYPSILHSSDIGLVTLKKEVKTPVVPSKLLAIMSAGRPVVASLACDGDAPRIISEAKCGICVEAEDSKMFAKAIREIYENRGLAEDFGRNGRKYAENEFALSKCAEKYIEMEVGYGG
jgi:glycosyltransferase involved in cell wall biosynthesis